MVLFLNFMMLMRTCLIMMAAAAAPIEDVPDTVPHPFVRIVQYFMDNCAGTNKSQFMFGVFVLLMLKGVLDAMIIEFMLSGHTKMALDCAFSDTGNSFRSSDVFNHGMLHDLFQKYFSVHSYGADFLNVYKEATTALFGEVKEITKQRSFVIAGDDGKMQADLILVPVSEGGSDHTYTYESVQTALNNLATRSRRIVLRATLNGDNYRGVGDGTGYYGPRADHDMFPTRNVRLFARAAEGDGAFKEQVGYQKTMDADAIAASLRTIVAFSKLSEAVPF
jgi:hypothetical protein